MREVLVKIKSASHRCEDLEIPCELSVTVKELKKLIQFSYPLHPEVGDQRLIYAGHLLEDSQTLAQVLLPNSEPSQSSFTLHLACTSNIFQPQRQQPSGAQETKDAPKTPAPAAAQSMSYGQQRSAGVPPELLSLHQQYVQQMMTYMNEWSQGRYNSVDWSNLQHVNPIYYANSQNASVDSPGGSGTSDTPTPDRGNTTGESTQDIPNADSGETARIAETARVEENARVAVEAARAAAEAARVANAARVAAARRDDDDPPRDIIDWMYTLSRVALIFSVVYFYSNFTRFFLVVILSALVFILQRRPFLWNGRQPAVQEAPAAAPRPIGNPIPEPPREEERQPEVNANGVNAVAGEGVNPPETQDATVAEENPVELIAEAQENARINPRDVTWTFLTTFFTSLIPEIPQN